MKKTGTFFLLRDNIMLGLILGFLLPLLVCLAIYYMRFSSLGMQEFFPFVLSESRLITFFGAWCLVANIALFTFYINTHKDRTARGVFIMSVFWGLLVLLLKFLL